MGRNVGVLAAFARVSYGRQLSPDRCKRRVWPLAYLVTWPGHWRVGCYPAANFQIRSALASQFRSSTGLCQGSPC